MGRRVLGRPLGLTVAVLLFLAPCGRTAESAPASGRLIQLLGRRALQVDLETRQISFGDGGRPHLLSGWSVEESSPADQLSFVWATARESTLWFRVLQVEDQQVLVKLRAFPTEARQTIVVLVNGHEVATLEPETIFLEYRFVIPKSALEYGRNRMTFRHAALGRPAGAPPESREFAVAYSSLLIGPQCLPLRGFGPPAIPGARNLPGRLSGPLVVTGPAELRQRIPILPGARLHTAFALPPHATSAAVVEMRITDAKGPHPLATVSLSPGWLRRTARKSLTTDLSAWAGSTVELSVRILPERCRSASTELTIDTLEVD